MNTSDFFDHFGEHFSGLNDPRLERMKHHSLKDILLLTTLALFVVQIASKSFVVYSLYGNIIVSFELLHPLGDGL